jgi:hypothetical protein
MGRWDVGCVERQRNAPKPAKRTEASETHQLN